MTITKPVRAALYGRVSTTGHGQDTGLQLEELRRVADARGWAVVQEFVDEGVSGTQASRPGLDAMMEAARLGKLDLIAFWRLDRLGRSLSHVVQLLDELALLKVDIVSLKDAGRSSTNLVGLVLAGQAIRQFLGDAAARVAASRPGRFVWSRVESWAHRRVAQDEALRHSGAKLMHSGGPDLDGILARAIVAKKAPKGPGLRPTQEAVSGPQVDRLAADMAENGFNRKFPVRVDGDLVVEGHHRVMAAKKAGVEVVTTPGTVSNASKANALKSFDDIKVDPVDWYD